MLGRGNSQFLQLQTSLNAYTFQELGEKLKKMRADRLKSCSMPRLWHRFNGINLEQSATKMIRQWVQHFLL
jgi:hypothetical protein